MDDYTLSMAEAINEHQGNADADHFVNVSMAEAINEYQDRFSADTEGVTEHQATIPADTNHSPGAKIVFASADEPWLDEMAHPFSLPGGGLGSRKGLFAGSGSAGGHHCAGAESAARRAAHGSQQPSLFRCDGSQLAAAL